MWNIKSTLVIGVFLLCSTTYSGDKLWKKHVIEEDVGYALSARGLDVNSDGIADILSSRSGEVVLFLSPHWQKKIIHTLSSKKNTTIIHSTLIDVDGDGDLDLVASVYGKYLFWLQQPENGSTGKWKYYLIDTKLKGSHCLSAVDIDGDGKMELLAGSALAEGQYPESLVYFHIPENPTKTKQWKFQVFAPESTAGSNAHYFGTGDVNGDGLVDIACAGKGEGKALQGAWFAWWEQPKNPQAEWKKRFISQSLAGATHIEMMDVNQDKKMDFVATCGHGKGVYWFEAPHWKPHAIDESLEDGHTLLLTDLDGDGDKDLVLCSNSGAAQMVWYEYDFKSKALYTKHVIDKGNQSYHLSALDMDGDGDLDILNAGAWSNNLVWYENPLK